MDENKNVVDLDRTLYDVDFIMRKFKVVDSKEVNSFKILGNRTCSQNMNHDVPWIDIARSVCVDREKFAFYGNGHMRNGSSLELNVHACNRKTERAYGVKCKTRA